MLTVHSSPLQNQNSHGSISAAVMELFQNCIIEKKEHTLHLLQRQDGDGAGLCRAHTAHRHGEMLVGKRGLLSTKVVFL